MSTIVCGSIAYDNIMSFEEKFSEHIIPDKLEMLNVSFLVPGMRQEFGGCAGNIAYNLKKLGSDPLVLGSVGKDFSPYADWMDKNHISRRFISESTDSYTAQAFIITDSIGNQITAFHPGAMENPIRCPISEIEADLAIVSPYSKNIMSKKTIIFEPNPILRKKSEKLNAVDDDLRKLMDDMLETMYAAPGIGLAAVQQIFLFRKTGWALKTQL